MTKLITFIKGLLSEITSSSAIVDNNGVGYEIFCPLNDLAKLASKIGSEILIYTHLVHREDSMTLYGFLSERSRKGFFGLLKVGGIGPKAAIKILSHHDVDDLFNSVENEDVKSLEKIPGIGPKLAKQIVFDLKGVLPDLEKKNEPDKTIEKDLISAMVNLGYRENDVRNILNELKPIGDDFEAEFKRFLKKMAGK